MKFLSSQITYFLSRGKSRKNLRALLKFILFLIGLIAGFTIIFHLLMRYVEGRTYSWLTGLYWTLTVMSTLGFGDITFSSDIGRLFSIVVLVTGIIAFLIVLPFTFIRFFYAPWLEAQLHAECPRQLPEGTTGHVLICRYDAIAENLMKRLAHNKIPHFIVEQDPATATEMYHEGIPVVQGNLDSRKTYERLLIDDALLLFANDADTTNTNITLTAREASKDVRIVATAERSDSVEILRVSGATNILPLKQTLGQHLANRISIGRQQANIIGKIEDWRVVEFIVNKTRLSGLMIRDTKIREETGVNIIGVWQKGRLVPATPNLMLTEFSVPLGIGTQEQMERLEKFLDLDEPVPKPILIIGGGKVGRAAAATLQKKGMEVFMIERNASLRRVIGDLPDRLTIGDASDRDTLMRGGLMESSLVIISTNDDAVNIYLSIYCRKLHPDARIISRVTHEYNIEAMHRAGADFVLSYAPLGAEAVMSLIQGRDPIIMGEGVESTKLPLPASLVGKTLLESSIGSLTGLIVLNIESGDDVVANPPPETVLPADSVLRVLGTAEQIQKFKDTFK